MGWRWAEVHLLNLILEGKTTKNCCANLISQTAGPTQCTVNLNVRGKMQKSAENCQNCGKLRCLIPPPAGREGKKTQMGVLWGHEKTPGHERTTKLYKSGFFGGKVWQPSLPTVGACKSHPTLAAPRLARATSCPWRHTSGRGAATRPPPSPGGPAGQ